MIKNYIRYSVLGLYFILLFSGCLSAPKKYVNGTEALSGQVIFETEPSQKDLENTKAHLLLRVDEDNEMHCKYLPLLPKDISVKSDKTFLLTHIPALNENEDYYITITSDKYYTIDNKNLEITDINTNPHDCGTLYLGRKKLLSFTIYNLGTKVNGKFVQTLYDNASLPEKIDFYPEKYEGNAQNCDVKQVAITLGALSGELQIYSYFCYSFALNHPNNRNFDLKIEQRQEDWKVYFKGRNFEGIGQTEIYDLGIYEDPDNLPKKISIDPDNPLFNAEVPIEAPDTEAKTNFHCYAVKIPRGANQSAFAVIFVKKLENTPED